VDVEAGELDAKSNGQIVPLRKDNAQEVNKIASTTPPGPGWKSKGSNEYTEVNHQILHFSLMQLGRSFAF